MQIKLHSDLVSTETIEQNKKIARHVVLNNANNIIFSWMVSRFIIFYDWLFDILVVREQDLKQTRRIQVTSRFDNNGPNQTMANKTISENLFQSFLSFATFSAFFSLQFISF